MKVTHNLPDCQVDRHKIGQKMPLRQLCRREQGFPRLMEYDSTTLTLLSLGKVIPIWREPEIRRL